MYGETWLRRLTGGVRRTSVGLSRAVLRGISPLIWRRLLVRSDSTLAQLHEVLQIAFGWDDEHLNRFEIRGREYAVYRDGAGMIGIDATHVRLCDLKLRRLERCVYEYDLGDSWIHDLRLETTLPVNPKDIYPLCVAGKCSAPPDDCGGGLEFVRTRVTYQCVVDIAARRSHPRHSQELEWDMVLSVTRNPPKGPGISNATGARGDPVMRLRPHSHNLIAQVEQSVKRGCNLSGRPCFAEL
jgi:hypothetical protein